MVISVASFPEN